MPARAVDLLLVLAIGGFSSLLRPDRIFLTVLRTFVPYLVTCFVLMIAFWITKMPRTFRLLSSQDSVR